MECPLLFMGPYAGSTAVDEANTKVQVVIRIVRFRCDSHAELRSDIDPDLASQDHVPRSGDVIAVRISVIAFGVHSSLRRQAQIRSRPVITVPSNSSMQEPIGARDVSVMCTLWST